MSKLRKYLLLITKLSQVAYERVVQESLLSSHEIDGY